MVSKTHTELGKRMRDLRKHFEGAEFGSARRFARRIGLSESQWSNFENGNRRPGLKTALSIADQCKGISLDWIYRGEGPGLDELSGSGGEGASEAAARIE